MQYDLQIRTINIKMSVAYCTKLYKGYVCTVQYFNRFPSIHTAKGKENTHRTLIFYQATLMNDHIHTHRSHMLIQRQPGCQHEKCRHEKDIYTVLLTRQNIQYIPYTYSILQCTGHGQKWRYLACRVCWRNVWGLVCCEWDRQATPPAPTTDPLNVDQVVRVAYIYDIVFKGS